MQYSSLGQQFLNTSKAKLIHYIVVTLKISFCTLTPLAR